LKIFGDKLALVVLLLIFTSETKTIIEIDGVTHLSKAEKEYDALRTDLLEHQGYCVIRFSNQEIFYDLERVLQEVESYIKKRA
jgi:very-short-patch-repair endonuclease